MGLGCDVVITDKFDVYVNEGIEENARVVMPEQYHISYKTKKAKNTVSRLNST